MAQSKSTTVSDTDRQAFAGRLADGAAALGLILSAAQLQMLIEYLALLIKWNGTYNLTAVREPAQMVSQHLLDSLSAVPALASGRRVLDVGAGAGLPGIVLAIWAREAAPAMQVALVDTVHKKTAFLTQVKAELGLANVTVYTARVEALRVDAPFDLITSRAFAELADFVRWSGHLLAPGGEFVAMKGVLPSAEVARLPAGWVVASMQALTVPGMQAERHLVRLRRA